MVSKKKAATKKKTSTKKKSPATATKKKRKARKKPAADKDLPEIKFDYDVRLGPGNVQRLTHKQLMFCYEWLKDHNQTRAAKRAGYSTPYSAGHLVMRNEAVRAKIAQLTKEQAERLTMDVDEIALQWSRISRVSLRSLFSEDGGRLLAPHELDDDTAQCVQSIKVREEFAGRGDEREHVADIIEVKLVDKNTALANRARSLGMFKDTMVHEASGSLKKFLEEIDGVSVGPPGER